MRYHCQLAMLVCTLRIRWGCSATWLLKCLGNQPVPCSCCYLHALPKHVMLIGQTLLSVMVCAAMLLHVGLTWGAAWQLVASGRLLSWYFDTGQDLRLKATYNMCWQSLAVAAGGMCCCFVRLGAESHCPRCQVSAGALAMLLSLVSPFIVATAQHRPGLYCGVGCEFVQ